MGLSWENFRRNFEPSSTCLANSAVISLGGGQYLPHLLIKKSIKSSFAGIFLEKILAQCFTGVTVLISSFQVVTFTVPQVITDVIKHRYKFIANVVKVLDLVVDVD